VLVICAGLGWIGMSKFLPVIFKKYQTIKTLLTLINNTSVVPSKEQIIVKTFNNYAIIRYELMAQSYYLTVPYNQKYLIKMLGLRAYIIRDQKLCDNITQQPGIPYTVSANQLEADGILIINDDTGESHIYEADQSPQYAIEVLE
jgi:hypothetical protein